MPNPRKPTQLKIVAGTARADREPEHVVDLPLVSGIPDPPHWLTNPHALDEWHRITPILVANKLLTEAGTMPLAHLCALHGKVVQLYQAGESPNASMVGQLRGLANDFGLTPVAQGKVRSSGDTEKPGNKFGALGKPGAAR